MSDYLSWRSALLATVALPLVSLVPLFLFVPEAVPARARSDRTGFFGSVTRLFASPVFRWLFLAFAIAGTGIYSLLVFSAPFLVRAHGLSTAQIGLALGFMQRSEEHTSELQSLMRISYAVFCLKKKNKK